MGINLKPILGSKYNAGEVNGLIKIVLEGELVEG
jgi:hypothetical protein